MVRCQMCNGEVEMPIKFKNRLNGTVLSICLSCAVLSGLMPKPSGTHWECKYCGCVRSVNHPKEPEHLICEHCGAEWESNKVLFMDE